MFFFHNIGDTVYPANRSNTRRVSCAATKLSSMDVDKSDVSVLDDTSKVFCTAFNMAVLVISVNRIRWNGL